MTEESIYGIPIGKPPEGYQEKRARETNERKEREKQEKIKRAGEIKDMRWLMSDPRGRRIALRILMQTQLVNVTDLMNSDIYKREGKRILGNWWMKEMAEADHKQLALLIGEIYEPGN